MMKNKDLLFMYLYSLRFEGLDFAIKTKLAPAIMNQQSRIDLMH